MIIKTVHYAAFDNTSIDEGTLHLLIKWLEFNSPRFVIEAGTYVGHFACVAGGVLTNLQKGGRVWTFDPEDFGAKAWIEKNGLTNVEYVPTGFEELPVRYPWLKGVVDLAFIDSGPDGPAPDGFNKNMRYEHFQLAKEFLRPRGTIIVDDLDGQWEHVEEVRDQCVVLEGGRGVGIWQKR